MAVGCFDELLIGVYWSWARRREFKVRWRVSTRKESSRIYTIYDSSKQPELATFQAVRIVTFQASSLNCDFLSSQSWLCQDHSEF